MHLTCYEIQIHAYNLQQRSLAAEFQSTAPNDSTVPTKYWRRVEAELADLYEKNGEERDSDARWKL